jgi:hypothetical protein
MSKVVTFGQRFRIRLLVLAVQLCAAVQREAEGVHQLQARAAPATVNGRFAQAHASNPLDDQQPLNALRIWEGSVRLQSISPDTGQQGDALVREAERVTFVHVSGEAGTGLVLCSFLFL